MDMIIQAFAIQQTLLSPRSLIPTPNIFSYPYSITEGLKFIQVSQFIQDNPFHFICYPNLPNYHSLLSFFFLNNALYVKLLLLFCKRYSPMLLCIIPFKKCDSFFFSFLYLYSLNPFCSPKNAVNSSVPSFLETWFLYISIICSSNAIVLPEAFFNLESFLLTFRAINECQIGHWCL